MEQTYKPTYIVVYSFPIRLGLQCGSTVCLLASILGVAAGISIYTIVLRAVLSFFMLGIFGWILGMIIEDIDKKAQKKAEQEEDDIQHGITPQLPKKFIKRKKIKRTCSSGRLASSFGINGSSECSIPATIYPADHATASTITKW